jgi:hypothetical protein
MEQNAQLTSDPVFISNLHRFFTELGATARASQSNSESKPGQDFVIRLKPLRTTGSQVITISVVDNDGRLKPASNFLVDGLDGTIVTLPSESSELSSDIREWALSQGSEQEIVAALEELRQKGGTELSQVIKELQQG